MQAELVVLSHLRWDWVWQRPHHLISRIGRGRRTWFVEEPWPTDVAEPCLRTAERGGVTRVWLDIPSPPRPVSFDDDQASGYTQLVSDLLGAPLDERIVWIYTPLALDMALALEPTLLVYDVMDDLASFKDAPPGLVLRQRQALREADVVFTAGRSLHRSVLERRRERTYIFPSGVEPEHYERARDLEAASDRPVAGYVGVIDERLDLELLSGLAQRLPHWEIRLVGPVVKIQPSDLPQAPNIAYLGLQPYARLPEVMAEFDVAVMPFALNEATRSISPTKTLEYLAAGLPVVSTHVPDVVADYHDVVDLQEDAAGFARACERVGGHDLSDRDTKLRPLLYQHHWDTIASHMSNIVNSTPARGLADEDIA